MQFGGKDSKEGFGLGFHMQNASGERSAGHNGAIYGFATHLNALVDAKLGVVVIASKDFVNTVTDKIGAAAIQAMLSAKRGTPAPETAKSEPIALEVAKAVAGRYTNQTRGFELMRNGTNLTFLWQGGGFIQTIREHKGKLVSDGPIGFGMQLSRKADSDVDPDRRGGV